MIIEKKNIFVIQETIVRKNLQDYFWPSEQKNSQRESLMKMNKKDGWICQFSGNGLVLDITILINKLDSTAWQQCCGQLNANTIKSDFLFYENFKYEFSEPHLKLIHPAELAEDVRKKIYISERFGAQADQIWSAQYLEDIGKAHDMYYLLGFNRAVLNKDEQILSELKSELAFFNNVRLL